MLAIINAELVLKDHYMPDAYILAKDGKIADFGLMKKVPDLKLYRKYRSLKVYECFPLI